MWERDLDEMFSLFECGVGLGVFLFDRSSEVGEYLSSFLHSYPVEAEQFRRFNRSGLFTSEFAVRTLSSGRLFHKGKSTITLSLALDAFLRVHTSQQAGLRNKQKGRTLVSNRLS